MTRAAGIVCGLLVLSALAGCGDDDDPAATTTTSTTATTAVANDELELLEVPVAGFAERSATFANLDYTLLDATVTNQDLRAYADGSGPSATANTHLIVDVRVTNDTARQLESDADAIALELDGRNIGVADDFLSDVTGFIGANQEVDGFLAFAVDPDTAVDDAVIVFGVEPDRTVSLPLTGAVDPDVFPVELALTGAANGAGPTNSGTIAFEVIEGTLFVDLPHGDTTSPTGERADEGEVFIQVHVQATKTDGRGNDLLSDAAFRLLVDGVARAPFDVATAPTGSTPTPTAEPGVTVDAWVLFAVDAGADTYVLEVGDADAPGGPGSIPLAIDVP